MAAKSVLKSSVSAVLAAALGASALLPVSALAQERPDRGERGAGRAERSMPAPPPMRSAPPPMARPVDRPAPSVAQAPSWQGRGPAANPQPSWSGRPTWSQGGGQQGRNQQGGGQPDRGPRAEPPSGSNGRPSWQQGDRGDRGDRGSNGGPVYSGPSSGRPGGAVSPPAIVTNTTPAWGGRNPTYVDPRRNPSNSGQPNPRDWNRNGNGNGSGNWNRDRDRDRDGTRNWNRDGNRTWANGWTRGGDRDWNRNRDWNRGGYSSNQWRGNNRWGNNNYGNRGWDRNGWRRDSRYNWSSWRNSHRNVFRGGAYYAPYSGYSYSRLSIGLFLGNAFFDQRYWISDPYAYRLPPAYEPYQWVRYYDDVLLIDTYSGEVVDVIYDFFD